MRSRSCRVSAPNRRARNRHRVARGKPSTGRSEIESVCSVMRFAGVLGIEGKMASDGMTKLTDVFMLEQARRYPYAELRK